MIIQQYCMFAFDEIMKFQPETKLQMTLNELDFSKLEKALGKKSGEKGPKGYSVSSLIAALISAQYAKDSRINKLVERLKSDPVLRWTCGFDVLGRVPSESVFSRLYGKLAESEELAQLFYDLVKEVKSQKIIDGNAVAIDSSQLLSYEKARPADKLDDDCKTPH